MLGTSRPTQNSAGAVSRLQKTHLKSVCLQYPLCRLVNSHCFCLLKNGMGLIIFFLCAYVPKTEARYCKWAEVLKDLERIKSSKDIDVSLYTANADEDEECQELVIRCFFLETQVIIQECNIKNCSKTQDVRNIWKNLNETFDKKVLPASSKPAHHDQLKKYCMLKAEHPFFPEELRAAFQVQTTSAMIISNTKTCNHNNHPNPGKLRKNNTLLFS
ncbi:interleukin-15 isoform 2-T2 [Acridotheres tristis]